MGIIVECTASLLQVASVVLLTRSFRLIPFFCLQSTSISLPLEVASLI
jgi:hypothetical protein